jgi:hypothetical protein
MTNPWEPNTKVEVAALKALRYPSFSLNLSDVKRTIAEMHSLIGRNGIFAEYSKHDISHVNSLLEIADWLVDENTRKIMTAADWFLITLSIYFHDLGMLVTEDEFNNRNNSSFPDFCNTVLFAEKGGAEYRARVQQLEKIDAERFLYQEFVRANHAHRVRDWILGNSSPYWGDASSAKAEIDQLLARIDPALRRDLALIAESHHLDDLDDASKYKPIQPYGTTDDETANLQYCAVILRAADILHMQKGRTPSVLFRLINPADPISQREWAKQNSVRRVMPRMGINEEGKPDSKAPRDIIEVYATYTDEDGFFGLTSFLAYVSREIQKCHEWTDKFRNEHGARHEFIWKRVADDKVDTEGFLRKPFSFNLDQDKILDLLIGHTLYNNTDVVIRELTQNSLDAIRLRQEQQKRAELPVAPGKVLIQWSTKKGELTVSDNGTGMTQEVIEKHLLKVGSSRYQDPKFKEQFPEFSPISRFGIGVLSTFMVSDEVEITTCSPEEVQGRKISLRSVHGRYLVRLLDKNTDPEAIRIGPHGTRVRLKLRSTAELKDIVATVRQWIVIPKCHVEVAVDDAPPVKVGYNCPGDALKEFISFQMSHSSGEEQPKYKVVEKKRDGVELAYVVSWSEFFKDWSFLPLNRQPTRVKTGARVPCTCIEGVAVEFISPGLRGPTILAIANASGATAPKTNVARSSLEAAPQTSSLYSKIYEMYAEHINDEIERMVQNGYSLTWAVTNAVGYLPRGMIDPDHGGATLIEELRACLRRLPVFIIERAGCRRAVTIMDLVKEHEFWTVDCELTRSAETLIREASSNSSVADVVKALGDAKLALPTSTVLYNLDRVSLAREFVEAEFAPKRIVINESLRRSEIQWSTDAVNDWTRIGDLLNEIGQFEKSDHRSLEYAMGFHANIGVRSRFDVSDVWVAKNCSYASDLCGYAFVGSWPRVFFLNSKVAVFLKDLCNKKHERTTISELLIYIQTLLGTLRTRQVAGRAPSVRDLIARARRDLGSGDLPNAETFIQACEDSQMQLFDTSVWSERSL